MTKAEAGTWPKAWSEEKRSLHYQAIVGKPYTGKARYKDLLEVIDERVTAASAQGRDPVCFGVAYDANDKLCEELCPHMPACAAVLERRPDILKEVEAANDAMKEAGEASEEDAASVAEAAKPKRWIWIGKLATFEQAMSDSDEDKAMIALFSWMQGQKKQGFDLEAVLDYVREHYGYETDDERREFAEQVLAYLKNEGAVK